MEQRTPIPTSLVIVAVLFILGGVCAAIEVVLSLMHDHLNINFGVVGIFIGWGLLRRRRGWRTCALVFVWIAMIGVAIGFVLLAVAREPQDLEVFGRPAGHIPKEIALVVMVIIFIISLWQYCVLTRSDVKRLFGVM